MNCRIYNLLSIINNKLINIYLLSLYLKLNTQMSSRQDKDPRLTIIRYLNLAQIVIIEYFLYYIYLYNIGFKHNFMYNACRL